MSICPDFFAVLHGQILFQTVQWSKQDHRFTIPRPYGLCAVRQRGELLFHTKTRRHKGGLSPTPILL